MNALLFCSGYFCMSMLAAYCMARWSSYDGMLITLAALFWPITVPQIAIIEGYMHLVDWIRRDG